MITFKIYPLIIPSYKVKYFLREKRESKDNKLINRERVFMGFLNLEV
jgi:hypothetical protein